MRLSIPEAARRYTHPDYLDGAAHVNLTDPARVRLDLTTVAEERKLADIRPILAPLLLRLAEDPSPLVPYPMQDRFLQGRLGRLVLDAFGGEALAPAQIFFAAGTYPLWKELAAFLLEKGTLLGAAPLYPEFPGWWRALGGRYLGIAAPDFSFPLSGLLEALGREADAVAVLVDAPGNASGLQPTPGELETLLGAAASRGVLVVVDEAYANFLEPRRSHIGLVARHPNLVVIRSLSKAWDLRGIRFGFAVFPPELAAIAAQIHNPFEPDTFSVAAAEHLLRTAPDFTAPLRHAVIEAKTRLVRGLTAAGITVLPSVPEVPNLIMTHPELDLAARLAARGVKVVLGTRFASTSPGLDGRHCRIRVPVVRHALALAEIALSLEAPGASPAQG